MLPRIMKLVSSAALLLMVMLAGSVESYQLPFTVVVFLGAIVVLVQAIGTREYFWAAAFIAIALVFNPVAPLFQTAGNWFLMMALVCTAVFAVSLTALKARPALSMPSITKRHRRSEFL